MPLLTEIELEALLEEMDDKWILFCREYIIDHNATRAARRAGFSQKNSGISGHRLLSKAKVKKLLGHLKAERDASVKLSGQMVIKELMRIAFQDIAEYVDFDGDNLSMADLKTLGEASRAVRKIKTTKNKDQSVSTELEVYDKLKALELLGKHTAIFTEKIDLTNNGKDLPETNVINNIVVNHRKKGETLASEDDHQDLM